VTGTPPRRGFIGIDLAVLIWSTLDPDNSQSSCTRILLTSELLDRETGRQFCVMRESGYTIGIAPNLCRHPDGSAMTYLPIELPTQLDLEEFVSEQTHDLRSPFNQIIGFSKMLQSESNPNYPPELRREDAGAIYRAGQRALLLMNGLIDIVRLKRHEKEVDLAELEIKPALEQGLAFWKKFNPASSLQTDYQIVASASRLNTDEVMLRQVLCSFIMVVAQYVDPQAKVTLTVEEEPDWLVIKVVGVGKKERPFSQLDLHMQGYIGRAFVELQQGEIRAAEETDDGAAISFALPKH
jgi:signal transduction histidine kinase